MKVTVSFLEVHPSSKITRLPGTISVSATSLALHWMEGKPDASFTQPPVTGWAPTGEAARRPASPRMRVSAPVYAPLTSAPRRYGGLPLRVQSTPFPSESTANIYGPSFSCGQPCRQNETYLDTTCPQKIEDLTVLITVFPVAPSYGLQLPHRLHARLFDQVHAATARCRTPGQVPVSRSSRRMPPASHWQINV